MKSGIVTLCITILMYLLVRWLLLFLGYDITNDRLIVFIALTAMVISWVDFLNVKKSKLENEIVVMKDVCKIKDRIKIIKHNIVNKYDLCRSLFTNYIHQVFEDDELDEICKNNLSGDKKKFYCEKIDSFTFDDKELKEMIKYVVKTEISPEVEVVVEEEDYTVIKDIVKNMEKEIERYERIIKITIGLSIFALLLVMICFDCLIVLFPKMDMHASIIGFFIIICTIIFRETDDDVIEDIKLQTREIIEDLDEEKF